MKNVNCPYCGQRAEYVDSRVIYGRSYGMVYLCRPCDAYVGTHKGTDRPLGRLANEELRRWRNRAHALFDPLWRHGRYKGRRGAAYQWLANQMGLTKNETHIAMFDVKQCKRVVGIMETDRRVFNGKY